jgi:hypothetical protein
MATERGIRSKLAEWLRRYLPLEIAGWIGELGSAALVYTWTGSLAAAAGAATVGASVGYYLPAYINAVRWSATDDPDRPWPARLAVSNAKALRSLTVEFGAGEVVDSLVLRPILIYTMPVAMGNVVLGWIVGGFLADVLFYVFAICSYERFKGLLVIRRPGSEGVAGEPVAAVAAA